MSNNLTSKIFPLLILLITILVSLIILSISFLNSPESSRKISSEKIISRIQIFENNYGIPYIYASSTKDMFFGIAFYQAKVRLPYLEFLRAKALGKSSSILGEKYLEEDKFYRSLGLQKRSEEILKRLDITDIELINCFVNGINEFINNQLEPHMEFQAFSFYPEPWNATDILSIILLKEIINDPDLRFEFLVKKDKSGLLSKIFESKIKINLLDPDHFYNTLDKEARNYIRDDKRLYTLRSNSALVSFAHFGMLELPSEDLFINCVLNDTLYSNLYCIGSITPIIQRSQKVKYFNNDIKLDLKAFDVIDEKTILKDNISQKINFNVDTIRTKNSSKAFYRAFFFEADSNRVELIYNPQNLINDGVSIDIDLKDLQLQDAFNNENIISSNMVMIDDSTIFRSDLSSNKFLNHSSKHKVDLTREPIIIKEEFNLSDHRLYDLLSEGTLEILDLHLIENDIYSSFADTCITLCNELIQPFKTKLSDKERKYLKQLVDWDRLIIPEKIERRLFSRIIHHLTLNISSLNEDLTNELVKYSDYHKKLLLYLLNSSDLELDKKIEWVMNSFRDAVSDLMATTIDKYRIDHYLSKENPLFESFSSEEFTPLGNANTIRFFTTSDEKLFSRNTKMIFDINDLENQIYLHGGQSGSIREDNYNDQFRIWLNGGYIAIDPYKEMEVELDLKFLIDKKFR